MPKRLLIVDDEDDIRTIVTAALEELAGWHIIEADTVQTGLDLAVRAQPDAILLDISMPDRDGFNLFAQLQDQPATQAIPVIVFTSKVLAQDRSRFATLAIAGVITKPFDPLRLGNQIASLLAWEIP
ncbi:response regulator [Leptolyngbya sp. BL0902]|uniref:response regulator n=1 Tax=Leptolyngbya sp. BL0902 TaxID=1115757 RepID=UPI0018E85A3D|nr:response regulator [Leptolyngbya sp. BL0902]QQE65003.1 response regulator [Leptolyngbya sp. BL0902]